jgi:hypothetical protein
LNEIRVVGGDYKATHVENNPRFKVSGNYEDIWVNKNDSAEFVL